MPGTRKLGKPTDARMAMLRQQVTDLLDRGRMETTFTRAKEIQPLAEKMITLGKQKDMASYRQALSFITREDVAHKVFNETAAKYADRNGGYTRVTRIGPRRGDAAEMAVIELVDRKLTQLRPGSRPGRNYFSPQKAAAPLDTARKMSVAALREI